MLCVLLTGIDLYVIVNVKVEFLRVQKIYVIPSLGIFDQCVYYYRKNIVNSKRTFKYGLTLIII